MEFLSPSAATNVACRLRVGGTIHTSSTARQSLNPEWRRQQFSFPIEVPSACAPPAVDSHGSSKSKNFNDALPPKPSKRPAEGGRSSEGLPLRQHLMLIVEMVHDDPDRKSFDKTGEACLPILGSAAVEFLDLVLDRRDHWDYWVPLQGGGAVRLCMDFDAVYPPPQVGSRARLVRLCPPGDLQPLDPYGEYIVEDVSRTGVLLSFTSREGWKCFAEVPRSMVQALSMPEPWTVRRVVSTANSVASHVLAAPAGVAVNEALKRASGGCGETISVAGDACRGTISTLKRWIFSGPHTAVNDVRFCLGMSPLASPERHARGDTPALTSTSSPQRSAERSAESSPRKDPVRYTVGVNCPITGCPIEEPCVAADGHTYEKAAIERWFEEHDTSPVTGEILPTKALFKNYSLISSASVNQGVNSDTIANITPTEKVVEVIPAESTPTHRVPAETLPAHRVPAESQPLESIPAKMHADGSIPAQSLPDSVVEVVPEGSTEEGTSATESEEESAEEEGYEEESESEDGETHTTL